MAILPSFRLAIFSLIILFSLVVLGIDSYFATLTSGVGIYDFFVPLGIAAAALSVISLPLFWFLGTRPTRVFTSVIVFEIIWFFFLWLLWAGTIGDSITFTVLGCVFAVDAYGNPVDISNNPFCVELIVMDVFAFLCFFCAFIYYDIIFLYAIINALRGRGVWGMSVKEAAQDITPAPVIVAPMGQPLYGYPATVVYGYPPPNQPYNAYPQQVPLAQPYNPSQGAPDAQYNAYPPQQYYYPPAPGVPQQQTNYTASPIGDISAVPPQPSYSAHPVHGSQAPPPNGYQA